MTAKRFIGLALAGWCALLVLFCLAAPADEKAPGGDMVRIGLVTSLFRDVPPNLVEFAKIPFKNLLKTQTGLNGDMVVAGDPLEVGKQLEEKKLHLGVFHGVEFAWAQERYPNLKPLMIAVNYERTLYANVVIRDDAKFTSFAELKNKVISLPRRSREHCHLFVQKLCQEAGGNPTTFFEQTVAHSNVEDALDDLLRGKVQATIADSVSLECYKAVNPGRYARLKILNRSELFPAAVIVYRQGNLDAATVKTFRDGMMNANQTAKGRDLMALWKLTAFESIPNDFQQQLDNIRRAFPAATYASAPTPEATPEPMKKTGK